MNVSPTTSPVWFHANLRWPLVVAAEWRAADGQLYCAELRAVGDSGRLVVKRNGATIETLLSVSLRATANELTRLAQQAVAGSLT